MLCASIRTRTHSEAHPGGQGRAHCFRTSPGTFSRHCSAQRARVVVLDEYSGISGRSMCSWLMVLMRWQLCAQLHRHHAILHVELVLGMCSTGTADVSHVVAPCVSPHVATAAPGTE